jgi:hypothetical protein
MSAAGWTPWFDPDVVPVHPGVYRRRWPAGPYACWDGRAWRADARSPEAAASSASPSASPPSAWQGLASPPEAPCLTCKGHGLVDKGFDEETGTDLIGECPDC